MYCDKCGAYVSDDSRFCPSCGRATGAQDTQSEPKYEQYQEAGYEQQNVYETRVRTGGGDILALLCYFGILLLIPYLIKPDSQFIRYHANQGLLLLLLGIASGAVAIIPLVGWLAAAIGGIFTFVCWIIGIVHVLNGTMKPLPIIGKYDLLK